MKYLIIMLFLVPMLASAQQRDKISEVSSLRYGFNPLTGDSTWYEVRTITWNDGSAKVDEQALRDTASVINFLGKEIEAAVKPITFYINRYWQAEQVARQHAKQAETLLGQFNSGISTWSIAKYREQFDSTAWEVKINGGQPQAATMVANPSGKRLLLKVGNNPNIQLFLVGDTSMILLNYPSQGQETDLIRVLGNNGFEFRDLTQSIKLKKL